MSKQTDLINIPDAIAVDGSNVGIGTSSPNKISGHTMLSVNTATATQYAGVDISTADAVRSAFYANNGGTYLETRTSTPLVLGTNTTERMRITNNGLLEASHDAYDGMQRSLTLSNPRNAAGTGDGTSIYFNNTGTSTIARSAYIGGVSEGNYGQSNALVFGTSSGGSSPTEAMRIDSSGNVLVGQSTTADPGGANIVGTGIASIGYISTSRNGNIAAYFNRKSSNGAIAVFRKDGTTVGSIGKSSSGFFIAGVASSDFGVVFDGSGLISSNDDGTLRDNQYNIGHPSYRWTNIYATNGSINTSDQTEKQDIALLTATEMLVAKRISAMFKNYRWKDKVATEGDSARTHTGVIAQDVQAAFTAEGLDASNYGLFCSDTWWEHDVDVPAVEAVDEVTDEDGNVTTEAVEAKDAYTRTDTYDTEAEAPEGATSKTRMGIRYPELLSFVAAYNEQRFASIEARLTALEA